MAHFFLPIKAVAAQERNRGLHDHGVRPGLDQGELSLGILGQEAHAAKRDRRSSSDAASSPRSPGSSFLDARQKRTDTLINTPSRVRACRMGLSVMGVVPFLGW